MTKPKEKVISKIPEDLLLEPSGIPVSDLSQAPIDTNTTPKEVKLDGKFLGIGQTATIWKTSSGRIELNRFTGALAIKLPSDITDMEKTEILRGIEVGRVELVDSVVSTEPINPSYNDLSSLHSVNIFLDEKKIGLFESNVKKTGSRSFLSLCLSTEESDRNRDEYKSILKEKLNTLS